MAGVDFAVHSESEITFDQFLLKISNQCHKRLNLPSTWLSLLEIPNQTNADAASIDRSTTHVPACLLIYPAGSNLNLAIP